MYEKNQPYATRRVKDECLRRMQGCACHGGELPVMNRPIPPMSGQSGPACSLCQNTNMPSLAMVYAPCQEWTSLLSPKDALQEGSLFRELVKPFCGRSVARHSR